MKLITTILLTIISLIACTGQEADTLVYYTEADILELKNDYNSALADAAYTIDFLESKIDSLIALNHGFKQVTDTCDILIYDDSISIDIKKKYENVWITITDGVERYNIWFLPEYDRIEYRYAVGANQEYTWDIHSGSFHYKVD